MPNVRLSQIIAVTGGLGSRATEIFGEADRLLKREDLFNGLRRSFETTEVNGQDIVAPPPEVKEVQKNVEIVLDTTLSSIAEWMDACLTRDLGNTVAKASVILDGETLIESAPVPFLLFLADQLGHVRKMLSNVPTLSPDKTWTENTTNNVWESGESYTNSYKTVKKPLVLYPATDKHPAQVAVADEEQYQGRKVTQHQSSAIPAVRKSVLLRRIERLQDAVKQAIQEANATSVEQQKVGHDLFAWILAD